ncbi:MAG: nitrous oxide reductase family maturation protein NosD, partial [Candidatus Hodarchaeota archaeon]
MCVVNREKTRLEGYPIRKNLIITYSRISLITLTLILGLSNQPASTRNVPFQGKDHIYPLRDRGIGSKTIDTTTNTDNSAKKKLTEYIDHSHIDINNDSAFSRYHFPGYGNITHPYLIANYNITTNTQNAINIRHTTMYFCIQNNLINGIDREVYGIYFNNVTHGTISDNIIQHCSGPIVFSDSYNNVISGNTISNNSAGIWLDSSRNNIISENFISNNLHNGIRLFSSCNANIISRNTISNNLLFSIWLESSCNDNTISKNTIINNKNGIFLWLYCNNNTISRNSISNPTGCGIALVISCNYNDISWNNVSDNSSGIFLDESWNNTISRNTISNNLRIGIFLWYSSNNNTISGNTIFGNKLYR